MDRPEIAEATAANAKALHVVLYRQQITLVLCVMDMPFASAIQAVQKLVDRLEKAEAAAANAEASRNAQVEAVVDQLLAFKQAQTEQLAQRDAQVADLHSMVLHLQRQVYTPTFFNAAVSLFCLRYLRSPPDLALHLHVQHTWPSSHSIHLAHHRTQEGGP